ncbi:MAG: ribonuclease PH [Fretibacterium sp.]|nr:ribonuclease PH [Fretibacterium sp.]
MRDERTGPVAETPGRHSGRRDDELRPVTFERGHTRYAEGSVLVSFGETRVLCTASVEERVPVFLRGTGRGWVTAEYALLPRSTDRRTRRERSGPSGRTAEIQRLIGRSLRTAVDLNALGPRSILLDCDVLQADGGTRTAAICGAFVAMVDALRVLRGAGAFPTLPLFSCVTAVSAGKVGGRLLLDLDSAEDREAAVDFNVVMDHRGDFAEVQGTGERGSFSRADAGRLFDLCQKGCDEIRALQLEALGLTREEMDFPAP